MRWAVGAIAACASCGRIGFGPFGAGSGADASDLPSNVVFTTSATFTGALGGLAGADATCTSIANGAGLTGRFVAWLSASTAAAPARLVVPGTSTAARGWVRTDGKPVADRVADLLAGTMYYPIRFDEHGVDLDGDATHRVLTGTSFDGTYDASNGSCLDWTTTSAPMYAAGDLARAAIDWTDFSTNTCTTAAHLYCFQVDYANPLPSILPATGRKAFVTAAPFNTAGHIDGADAQCASEAAANGLGTGYLAFAATTIASAASRFDPAPGPWVRLDGIPLAATGAATLSFELDTPINRDSSGAISDIHVWTGQTEPIVLATLAGDCQDWSSTSAADSGGTGKSSSSTSGFDDGTVTCDSQLPVYCFQQ